jgi:hypothetical protein
MIPKGIPDILREPLAITNRESFSKRRFLKKLFIFMALDAARTCPINGQRWGFAQEEKTSNDKWATEINRAIRAVLFDALIDGLSQTIESQAIFGYINLGE